MDAPLLCWTCQHPEDAERLRRLEAKRSPKQRRAKILSSDKGCVSVRMARDNAAKALRIILNLSRAQTAIRKDREMARELIEVGVRNGHVRWENEVATALTPIGKAELANISEWLKESAEQGGYAFADSRFHVSCKRLAVRAFCINALQDLENCSAARAHRRGRRASLRARSLLNLLDDSDTQTELEAIK